MKITFLSRNRRLYSTRRLFEAAEQRGHKVKVIDVLRCYMNFVSHNPGIHLDTTELERVKCEEIKRSPHHARTYLYWWQEHSGSRIALGGIVDERIVLGYISDPFGESEQPVIEQLN